MISGDALPPTYHSEFKSQSEDVRKTTMTTNFEYNM